MATSVEGGGGKGRGEVTGAPCKSGHSPIAWSMPSLVPCFASAADATWNQLYITIVDPVPASQTGVPFSVGSYREACLSPQSWSNSDWPTKSNSVQAGLSKHSQQAVCCMRRWKTPTGRPDLVSKVRESKQK